MTREEILSRLFEIIQTVNPDLDLTDLDPEIPLRDQVELDSMDFLDIVMELRKRYGIDVEEEDYMELTTLNRCVEYLKPKLEAAVT